MVGGGLDCSGGGERKCVCVGVSDGQKRAVVGTEMSLKFRCRFWRTDLAQRKKAKLGTALSFVWLLAFCFLADAKVQRRLHAQTRREWMRSGELRFQVVSCAKMFCETRARGECSLLGAAASPGSICELFHQFNPSPIHYLTVHALLPPTSIAFATATAICDCITPPPPPTSNHLQRCTCAAYRVVIVAVFTETPNCRLHGSTFVT